MGNIYFDKGQFGNALAEYLAALSIQRSIADTLSMSFTYLAAGNTYMELNQ